MISKSVSKWMRGIAILMVIASHYAAWMFVAPRYPGVRDFVMTLGVYGVDVFFAMSGYGLVKSAKKSGINGHFVWNRFKGSYLPYFLLVGIMMLADGKFHDFHDVFSFLTGQDYWFMAVLFVSYILFMVCYKIGKWKELTLFVTLSLFTYFLYVKDYPYFWIVSNLTFFAGVLLATVEQRFQTVKSQCILLGAGMAGTVCFYLWFRSFHLPFMNTSKEVILIEIFLSVFFAVTVMAAAMLLSHEKLKRMKMRVFSMLGTCSLFIYLLHTRLFYLLIFKFKKTPYLARVVLIAFVTVLLGWGIGLLYNQGVKYLELWMDRKSKKQMNE